MARKKLSKSSDIRTTILISKPTDDLLRMVRSRIITTAKSVPSNSKLIDNLLYLALNHQNPQDVANTVITTIKERKK